MIELHGALGWIAGFCVLFTTMAIILTGTWIVFQYLIWEILVKKIMQMFGIHKMFIQFIFYYRQFKEWRKNIPDDEQKVWDNMKNIKN